MPSNLLYVQARSLQRDTFISGGHFHAVCILITDDGATTVLGVRPVRTVLQYSSNCCWIMSLLYILHSTGPDRWLRVDASDRLYSKWTGTTIN